jgi:FMN phosphatase YigB (HAD superfamily)
MRLVESFDIFDTVLTRRVGDPRAAFLQLGHRLVSKGIIHCSAESFSRQRTAAEVRCFRNAGGLDSSVNIVDIYNEMRSSLGVDRSTHGKMIEEELDLESDLLVPLVDGASQVAAARERGHEVVFVSDMYLPSWFIREQLAKHNLIEDDDKLLVSNEYGASKATGALWPHVVSDLGVPAKDIHHTGNDHRSDFVSARRAGLRATFMDQGNQNRFEKRLETWAHETDGMTSLLAGASRLARTQIHGHTEAERAIRDVAAGVVTPFLVGNVLWILQQAVESHIEKIFFIARDGQILVDIARELAPSVGYTGELNYLYGSRQAWMAPSLTQLCEDQILTALPMDGDVDQVTLRLIAHRFDLKPEVLEPHLTNAGLPESMWDRALTKAECETMRTLLRKDEEVTSTILSLATGRREVMLKYLEQEGVVTTAPIAIVDQGTGSTLFNALSSVLETVDQRPPMAFYFGLRPDAADHGFGTPETYIRNEQDKSGFLKTPGLLTLVEMACTADHGSVTGYSVEGHRVVPELTEARNTAVLDWGFEMLSNTIRTTVRELCASTLPLPRHVDLRPATIDVFDDFWKHPTRDEAVAWSGYPFEDGWSGDTVNLPLAHRQGLREAVKSQPHRHWWNGGAEALSNPVSRGLLRGRTQAVSLVRQAQARLR